MLIQRGKETVEKIESSTETYTSPYVKQSKLETTEQLNNKQNSQLVGSCCIAGELDIEGWDGAARGRARGGYILGTGTGARGGLYTYS